MIASSTSASTATGGFYASFAMPAPEPPYSQNYAGYSSRGLGKTLVFSAVSVVLLIGAAYRGDPSADGPATELNHLPMEVPVGSELHLQHAKVYTAKIKDFVDDDPVSRRRPSGTETHSTFQR